jgi:hypothetical protein
MSAVVAAVDALAEDPRPGASFRWGDHRRLHAGVYRVRYAIQCNLVTIGRIDRVA